MACRTCRSPGDGGHAVWCPERGDREPLGEWVTLGVCGQMGPEKFEALNAQDTRKVCDSCPVQIECLGYGVANDEHEIFGGFTRQQRRSSPEVRRLLKAGAR